MQVFTRSRPDKPFRIYCAGEAMAELMLGNNEDHPAALGFAGDTMNTAVYLKRTLGDAAEVSYVTVLGHDPLSSRLVRLLESESIETELIQYSEDRLIGLYAITTDQSGERTFSYWRSQSAARTLFQHPMGDEFSNLAGADVVYLSAITLAILPADTRRALIEELDKQRSARQLTVVFDSNYRPALWESQKEAQQVVAAAWQITDIALPSVDDEQLLFNDADEEAVLSRLQGYGVKRGALKRGGAGPLSLNTEIEQSLREIDTKQDGPVQVVDTTAAGDSFNAGYLGAALTGADDQTALRAGHACAVRVIGHSGAIIPLHQWL